MLKKCNGEFVHF